MGVGLLHLNFLQLRITSNAYAEGHKAVGKEKHSHQKQTRRKKGEVGGCFLKALGSLEFCSAGRYNFNVFQFELTWESDY